MLAQEANEALLSRYCYCRSVEFIMPTQEANEALPSRYYCRCAELIMLAQETNEALPSRYCYCRCRDLIMLAQEANEALPSRYSYCRCCCAYNARSGGERCTSFQLNILNTKPVHPSVCPFVHRVFAKHYEKTTGC